MNHSPGHQQALIKNNICKYVLSFSDHNVDEINSTLLLFDYDLVIDSCLNNIGPVLNASWDGNSFYEKPFNSWTLGEDLKWHAPVPKPEGNFRWNEENQSWVEFTSIDNNTV